MEWAKGLKDRVERTATQISTQATTAFTPPPEDEEEAAAPPRRDPAAAEGAASAKGVVLLFSRVHACIYVLLCRLCVHLNLR